MSSSPNNMAMQRICHINDITEGTSRGFRGEGFTVFAVRKDEQLYLYHNRCPHLGVELEWVEDQFLDYEGCLIQCATHGALFTIEGGRCVGGPCLGETLQAAEFTIKDDLVWLLQ
ncbi:MAG: Rieske (2Fe-2S) protein [Pseudomonadales bacterium]